MSEDAARKMREIMDGVYHSESRRVFATLVRLLGDLDIAEEALHDAFRAALEQWPRDGVPANPSAWLVSAGRFKAVDGMRRRARFDALDDVAGQAETLTDDAATPDGEDIEDDRLRLIFTCCHPALLPEPEAVSLFALMLLHEPRRARTCAGGWAKTRPGRVQIRSRRPAARIRN